MSTSPAQHIDACRCSLYVHWFDLVVLVLYAYDDLKVPRADFATETPTWGEERVRKAGVLYPELGAMRSTTARASSDEVFKLYRLNFGRSEKLSSP